MCWVFPWEASRFPAPLPPGAVLLRGAPGTAGARREQTASRALQGRVCPWACMAPNQLSVFGVCPDAFGREVCGGGSRAGKPWGPGVPPGLCSLRGWCCPTREWWKFIFCGPLCVSTRGGWESPAGSGGEAGREEAESGIYSWLGYGQGERSRGPPHWRAQAGAEVPSTRGMELPPLSPAGAAQPWWAVPGLQELNHQHFSLLTSPRTLQGRARFPKLFQRCRDVSCSPEGQSRGSASSAAAAAARDRGRVRGLDLVAICRTEKWLGLLI